MELRTANFKTDFTTKEESGKKVIAGYFVVYDQPTELWDGYFEEIARDACVESIEKNDVRALYNHNRGFVLGRSTANTLLLRSDNYGVYAEIEINENDTEALNIYERVKRGDISGCSFAFPPPRPGEEKYIRLGENKTKCVIRKADVKEISVCPFPAYPQTQIIARKQAFDRRLDFEKRKNELKERLSNG